MSRARRALAAVALGFLLVGGSACTAERASEPTLGGSGAGYVDGGKSLTRIPVADRKPAPEISGRVLGEDTTVSTKGTKKVVVLNVWGSWCPPCRAEAADLQEASVATKAKAQFIGINTRDPSEAAAVAFARSQGVTYPSIYDPDGAELVKLAGSVSLTALPGTLIIDGQGRIAVRIVGATTKATLVGLIDDVAAGK